MLSKKAVSENTTLASGTQFLFGYRHEDELVMPEVQAATWQR